MLIYHFSKFDKKTEKLNLNYRKYASWTARENSRTSQVPITDNETCDMDRWIVAKDMVPFPCQVMINVAINENWWEVKLLN